MPCPKRISDFMGRRSEYKEKQRVLDHCRKFLKLHAPELLDEFEIEMGRKIKNPKVPKDMERYLMV